MSRISGKLNESEDMFSQQLISSFFRSETVRIERLPEQFLEFCRRSINATRGQFLYTDSVMVPDPGSPSNPDADVSSVNLSLDEDRIIALTPHPSTQQVAAVDTSTIKLGEMDGGSLCALRGAAVFLQNRQYTYVKYGPLIFAVGNFELEDEHLDLGTTPILSELNVDCMLRRVRNVFERWLQLNLSQSLNHSTLLFDGSLTAGTPDNPIREVKRILDAARQAGNNVIAISKNTKLRVSDKSITNLLGNTRSPCLLEIDDDVANQFASYPLSFLGRVYVGKLSRSGFAFRMDVDRQLTRDMTVEVLQNLIGAEVVDQGYPETLRIAHILSTFTASDALAMQAFASSEYGIQLLPKASLRRSLFGPFGTGWERWH